MAHLKTVFTMLAVAWIGREVCWTHSIPKGGIDGKTLVFSWTEHKIDIWKRLKSKRQAVQSRFRGHPGASEERSVKGRSEAESVCPQEAPRDITMWPRVVIPYSWSDANPNGLRWRYDGGIATGRPLPTPRLILDSKKPAKPWHGEGALRLNGATCFSMVPRRLHWCRAMVYLGCTYHWTSITSPVNWVDLDWV